MKKNKLSSKFEIRNSKQILISNFQITEILPVWKIWILKIWKLFRNSIFGFRISCFLLILFSFASLSFASEKVTILISGQSHASLYPCTCPKDPNGGVSRRAALIKQIKESDKNVLVLETGASFAGGNYDDRSQTTDLDKQRTDFYLKSLVKMKYDAFLISSEEFNFGEDFLKEAILKYKLNYLSANLKGNFIPYVIKEKSGVKFAIVGITDSRVKTKTQIEYLEAKETLLNTVKEIKKNKKADVIIALTYLDEKEAKEIINEIEGIDILVASNNPFRAVSSEKIKNTALVFPSWQARALTKISLTYDSKKPLIGNIENINLNKDIKDDAEISAIIPVCFTDKECRKQGFVGKCEHGAATKAECVFSEVKPVELVIIKPKLCKTCNIEEAIEKIKKILPNLKINYLEEGAKQAKELTEKLKIKMLPAYLIEEPKDKEEVSKVGQIAKKLDKYYVLEPGFAGVSYFTKREKIPNRLDVFFDIGTKDIVKIFKVLKALKEKNKNIDIHINFLAIQEKDKGFVAKAGKYEIEEFLRGACVNKYYPDKIWEYLSCRYSDIETSWWDDCAIKFAMDPSKVKACAQSEEGNNLLKESTKLTQELEVVFGPAFLINNQEVFSSQGAPTVEELEELFK